MKATKHRFSMVIIFDKVFLTFAFVYEILKAFFVVVVAQLICRCFFLDIFRDEIYFLK